MQALTTGRPSAPVLPDPRDLGLDTGIVTEPNPEGNRIVLWLPARREGGFQHWERAGSVPQTVLTVEPGILTCDATVIPARERLGTIAKLFGRFGHSSETSWTLPNGHAAEQCGERQAGFLFVWAENGAAALEPSWVESRWPDSKRRQKLGKNLYLVFEGSLESPSAKQAAEPPRQVGERMLAAARAAGDRAQELYALADLGALYLKENKSQQAIPALGEALKLARELGDRSREIDVLINIGLGTLAAGQSAKALEIFQLALAQARATGEKFAEKMALEGIGLTYAKANQPESALAAFEQAVVLARAVGHRKHEADLLWYAGIQHAELNRRDQALSRCQAAVELMKQMRNPQAAVFAEHLEKYRSGEQGAPLVGGSEIGAVSGADHLLGDSMVAELWAGVQGAGSPSLLRMALSAARSMARFARSGFKVVPGKVWERRLQTCAACEHHTGLRCRLCGCFTSVKARLDHEECPIGKWPA